MASLLKDVLNAFDQLILEVIDIEMDIFKVVEGETDWSIALLPNSGNQQTFEISDDLPFLKDFLIDAKQVWLQEANAKARSGFWTETLNNKQLLHLEATAIRQRQQNVLVITNQSEEFKHRQNTMQSARELLLFNDQLLEQNEYLYTRLLAILKKPNEQNNILDTLTKTIEKAGFGVLIANKELETITVNSAAENLFDISINSPHNPSKPMDIIIGLLQNQLPEYERIIATKSSWEGELCWMSPPVTLKWLKVALYPVKNEFNEVKNWIVFANDISNIKHLIQRNEQLAYQDMLTKLPNRMSFWQTLESKVKTNAPFYLLYIDINEFRRHNEFYGHDEGDKLLVEFGGRLKSIIKETDIIARIGGDQFAVILSDTHSQAACKTVVQRLLTCTKRPFSTTQDESYNISISIGAASFPLDAQSADDLVKFVDLSTHNGKLNNKDTLKFYSQNMKEASHKLIELEHDLKLAVRNNEFELFLQPIINLQRKGIAKAEALIRWNHPVKGMISPNDFIPVAEKSELIITIGKWVIENSCMLAQKLARAGYSIKITMNLSPVQVLDDNLFSYLHQCVTKYQVAPSLLGLEVTEGILVDDYSKVDKLLSKARALGLSVSVDDFGTGYSSLSHLKKLPLDFLKIDRTFVQDIVNDDNDKAIVKAVIAMAHNLNLGVIAEGVETAEQLSFLTDNACDSVQGYYFSKPISFDAFKILLGDNSEK